MYKSKLKKLYIASIVALIFLCQNSYSKSIELNGIKVSLTTDVVKKTVSIRVNEDEYSTTEYDKEEKTEEDKYVKIDMTIRNNNNYEVADITIDEIVPSGFRQVDSNKNGIRIKTKIYSKSEEKYEYTYKYQKSYLKDQYNSILYDENGDIVFSDNDASIDLKENIKNEDAISKITLDNESKDLRYSVKKTILFLVIIVLCIIILLAFIMFFKTMKSDDGFFDDYDRFSILIIFLSISFIINICFSSVIFAKSVYNPQIYEYGRIYEKVIYDLVSFNDNLYRFAYKITLTYESSYTISDEDFEIDTDGDGLVDALEYQYMTDKDSVDTDNDGLNDYLEVMYLDYNPLSDDTFSDGVKDGDRDFDNDKLINIEEVKYGTDVSIVDTDFDTLSDYDEINVYNTNPLSVDTDDDLLSDAGEIKLGLDPNTPRTDGVTLDSERKIEQRYNMTNVSEELRSGDIFISSISGSVSGNIDNEVKISKNEEEVFNSMSSFVSSGFRVEMKEDENIDIELDIMKVADRKTALTIVKFENGLIEAIDTVCNNNTLKANIGNGTYVVMDSEIVLRDLSVFVNDYMP